MAPKDFFDFYKAYGKKIHRFFAPLTIAATVIPLVTTAYAWFIYSKTNWMLLGMSLCVLLFFSTFFIYFKKANQSFTTQSITAEDLPKELNRWGNWHWTRVFFEFVAFVLALIALSQG